MTSPRKPAADGIMMTAFAMEEAATWDQECLVAAIPEAWLDRLETEYQKLDHVKRGYSLPTRGLEEIILAVDPAVMHVGSLRSEAFIVAFAGADRRVIAAAVAAWAATQITDGVDWFNELAPDDLAFVPKVFNVLEHRARSNGTAAPAAHVYDMLPTFAAKHIADAGLTLLGKPRELILGPPQRNNRRDVVLWPPIRLDDKRVGEGLVTAKISLHVETVPNHPRPHLHADLSISRFPLTPITYIPGRGATVWLHAPNGFLRQNEPHTLLAARVQRDRVRGGDGTWQWQWQWSRGLGEVLARLTHLAFPAPDKVFARPAVAADEGAIRAYVLYSGGTKSEAVEDDSAAGSARSRSLLHAARTGLVPGDHIEVHRSLTALLEPLGIHPTGKNARVGSRTRRQIRTRFDAGARYTIELWTHSDLTRSAVLATLERRFGLIRVDDGNDPDVARYEGDLRLVVLLRDGTRFAAGIKPEANKPVTTQEGLYAKWVERELGDCPDSRVAILELGDDRHFARIGRIDPKPSLKKGFARSGRALQCLRPATLRKGSDPYPGTEVDPGTVHRCAAAVNDALRQLGRLGTYELPAGLPDLEHIGIWLHAERNVRIPLAIRHNGADEPTAILAAPAGGIVEMPYRQLPGALARGRGRIGPGPRQDAAVAEFLIDVLGIGETPQTHDRIVFVRSSSFRHRGWDWIQDKHLTPDALVRPGVDLDDDQVPETSSPADCPGLRIVRIREAGSRMEVARAFGAEPEVHAERISGLFKFAERVYYAVNPRAAQMQTPLGTTKLDPDLHRNFTRMAASPLPLELTVAFQQPGDDTDALAGLAALLRRAQAHTEQDVNLPGVLHLCSLASEYL
ncbi:pPIWI_RE module domain-containing protein [Nucisporomicrobium flavum]|uniref:pPIWI_RE module domain-containing protein n=1 Tax=Nucisporomicrobium flavum TaxID=2785915 RepID=UPI003C30B818